MREKERGGREGERWVSQYYEQICFRAQDCLDYIARNNMTDITASIQPSGVSGDAFKRTDPVL